MVALEALVEEGLDLEQREEQEILLQLHHLKEIMEVGVQLQDLLLALVEAVLVGLVKIAFRQPLEGLGV
jgi:hypothetical protein